jgi:hypothetical protein
MSSSPPDRARTAGQSTVEVVAIVPALLAVVAVVWLAVAGALAWVEATGAARAGARAEEVGAPPDDAARAVLGARAAGVTLGAAAPSGRRPVRVALDAPLVPGGPVIRVRSERDPR